GPTGRGECRARPRRGLAADGAVGGRVGLPEVRSQDLLRREAAGARPNHERRERRGARVGGGDDQDPVVMRRWGATLVVALLVVPVLAASAQGESVRDDFETVSFEGDDGTRPWSGPWVEIGELDGPSGG